MKMDNLPNNIDELKAIIKTLLERIEKLEAENAELRRRLGLNSENSHKPPSSDGLKKKPAFPRENDKKTGGQKGHKGYTLKKVENPDIIVWHTPTECTCCGRLFVENDMETYSSRQVFDLPPQKLLVTEHRVGAITCCGHLHQGDFPVDVTANTQYGTSITALCALLSTHYKLPLEQISQLLDDLYQAPINTATIISHLEKTYQALEPVETTIKEALLNEAVLHCDETGIRVEGKNHWLHTACSENYTYLFVHSARGAVAIYSEESIIKDFKQNLVHDCWASYFLLKDCRHIICNAHILRELTGLIDNGSNWATHMHSLLSECYHGDRPPDNLDARYSEILKLADKEEPLNISIAGQCGKPKQSVGRCLLIRLEKYKDGILAFVFDKTIPFTNNQAERDIRCVKVKLKVSGAFRTLAGSRYYARIQSVISTLRKQKLDVFSRLQDCFISPVNLIPAR